MRISKKAFLPLVLLLFAIPAVTGATTTKGTPVKNYKKPETTEIKKALTPEQYRVTQQCGTEPPFRNAYWDNKKPGIYVDVVTGEPLFSSLDKFDSGTGWPSFTKPLKEGALTRKEDHEIPMQSRVEVRSKGGDSHLGHVFEDGPTPSGLRYCINSAALKFIPAEKLVEEGYTEFAPLFDKKITIPSQETAVLAGGCFWGVEELLRKLPGVISTQVGYVGGQTQAPTYEQVKKGSTGHAEAVQIVFDPAKLSYQALVEYFFRLHDPTTPNRQGNDTGTQYRSAIFYANEAQKQVAIEVKAKVERSGKWKKPLVTEIAPVAPFFPAEDFHQKYLEKHPEGYTCHYLRDL